MVKRFGMIVLQRCNMQNDHQSDLIEQLPSLVLQIVAMVMLMELLQSVQYQHRQWKLKPRSLLKPSFWMHKWSMHRRYMHNKNRQKKIENTFKKQWISMIKFRFLIVIIWITARLTHFGILSLKIILIHRIRRGNIQQYLTMVFFFK